MKTHSGAKKRFRKTATGKLRGRRAYSSHILEKKSPKRKRADGEARSTIAPSDAKTVKKLLPGGRGDEPRAPTPSPASGAQEGPQAGQGLLGPQALELPVRERAGHAVGPVRLPRPPGAQARDAQALDHPHQRRRPARGHELLGVHPRPQRGRRSRSTARCSPTSPCAIPRRSADLPSKPGRPWRPELDRRSRLPPGAPGGALFVSETK